MGLTTLVYDTWALQDLSLVFRGLRAMMLRPKLANASFPSFSTSSKTIPFQNFMLAPVHEINRTRDTNRVEGTDGECRQQS